MPESHLPLRALAVFEASARLGSFRAAALELGLTPSAVSHQVRSLEARSGVRLFERAGRGVSLSAEGRRFFESIREGFDSLRRASAELAARRDGGRRGEVVRLHTPPSFARRWLLPRLPALLERHPALDIRVTAEGGGDAAGADLAILYGDPRHLRDRALPLLTERVQPLCAPALLVRGPIGAPADLLAHSLISTRVNQLSWEAWFDALGMAQGPAPGMAQGASRRRGTPAGARIIGLDPSDVAIEAATKGLGVVLESDLLTAGEQAAGQLVAPLPALARELRSYWLTPVRPGGRPAVDLVRAWLFDAAAAKNEPPGTDAPGG